MYMTLQVPRNNVEQLFHLSSKLARILFTVLFVVSSQKSKDSSYSVITPYITF